MFRVSKNRALARVALMVGLAVHAPGLVEAQSRGQLFAAVADREGVPVLDLAASDFSISIGETEVEVVSAEVDSDPLKIALMVDNGNSMADANAENPLRAGLASFLDTLAPQHEVGVFTIARNLRQIADFSTDRTRLKTVTGEVFADAGAGARMMDGLFETWERYFDEDDSWPVFVLVLTDGGEVSGYVSDNDYVDFINALVARGANLHVLMFLRQGPNSRTGLAQTQFGLDLTKNTGGLYQTINAPTGFPEALSSFARQINEHYDELSTRYRIVYEVPDDIGPGGITVRLTGPSLGLQLYAGRRLVE